MSNLKVLVKNHTEIQNSGFYEKKKIQDRGDKQKKNN